MMIWSRIKCAWVQWTGTRAAWLALPAAGAIVASACLPMVGLVHQMPLGPAIAPHRAARASSPPTYTPPPYVPIYAAAYAPEHLSVPPVPPVAATAVPEPSSIALLATGLAGLLILSRRAKP
ncbi:MAG: PEP-CTERM sorting domain-containing protein [Acidiphilium sp.]|nr:PEP-CTERM sorting domain-containing protein [Acidiphilium sp.]